MEKSIRRLIKIKFDCILRWFTGSLSNSNTKKEPTSSPLCYYNPLTLVDTLTKWVIQRSQSCHGVRTETRSRYLWHRSLTPFNYMSSPLHTDNSSIWIPYRTVKTRGLVKTLDWKSQGFSVFLELILCEGGFKKPKINTADKIQISGFLLRCKNCSPCQSQDIMVKIKLRNIFSPGLILI